MTILPTITVSTIDRKRLYALLDNTKEDSDQVDYLYTELERASVKEPADLPGNVATLGSRLRFRNQETGKEHERVLVLPQETSQYDDAISILTPAGAAMLGLEVGATINWPHRGGHLLLELLAVIRD